MSFASMNTNAADGLPKARGTVPSYIPAEIGSNPYAAVVNPFDPLDRSGSKLQSNARIRTAFEPTRSKSMKNITNNNGNVVTETTTESAMEMTAVTTPEESTVPPTDAVPPSDIVQPTDVEVVVNPLSTPVISQSVIENSVIESPPPPILDGTIIETTSPLDLIPDFGSSIQTPARTPTKSMSVSQQVMEFLAPGSVSLGMGLFTDTIPENPPIPISPAGNSRSDRVRNAMRPNTTPTDLGPATFNVDVVRTKREVVQTQTVRLRRVDEIKGDSEWAASKRNITVTGVDAGNSDPQSSASPWSFTAVVKKEVVVEERKVGAVTVKRF